MKRAIKHGLYYILKETYWIEDHALACDFPDTISCSVHRTIQIEQSWSIDCVIAAHLWTALESLRPSSWHCHMIYVFSIQSSSLRIASPPHVVLLMGPGMAMNTSAMLGSYPRNILLDKRQENCSHHVKRARVWNHCWWLMSWNQVKSNQTDTQILWAEIFGG